MEIRSVEIEPTRPATELVPTVTAKRPPAGEVGEEERSAAEIVRLSSWATAECGGPILAD